MKKTFFKSAITVLFIISLTNCVYTRPVNLSLTDSNNMKNKTIAIVSREKSDMILLTPLYAAMLGGAIPYFYTVYKGNKIVKENNVEDPSVLIAKKLQNDLAKKYNLKIVDNPSSKTVDTFDVKKIADLYRGVADYVIDVRGLKWTLSYISMDISNYTTIYSGQLKLIDTNNSKVIAESSCEARPHSKHHKDVMLAENAKILKQDLFAAAEACSQLFEQVAFGLKADAK